MMSRLFILLCTTLINAAFVFGQDGQNIPRTHFTCTGRPSGYYADMETGCQVYHMCDGLGRQFSYSCPNTTLFQQRMLICDHWYMVNCSKSEQDYKYNLLIGQKDKPFVSDAEMQFRTPRPDILSVPPNSNYYDGLKEAESKYPVHPGNSIVGVGDSISSANNNGLDSGKPQYRPPSGWSTKRPPTGEQVNEPKPNTLNVFPEHNDNIAGAASQKPSPTIQDRPVFSNQNSNFNNIPRPNPSLTPPFPPPTRETESEEYDLDVRMKPKDPVYDFINRFDPNSTGTGTHRTAMSTSEILSINQQLPQGQEVSAEDERTPRKNKNINTLNTVQAPGKSFTQSSKFDSVNVKPNPTEQTAAKRIPVPDQSLQPPKNDYGEQILTTVGPPIYYEWKWAVPAFDLEPPKSSNKTESNDAPQARGLGRSPFRDVTRPTSTTSEVTPFSSNTEYNISSYYVPDYEFALDRPHPGYSGSDARTSFQVEIEKPGTKTFGENPACPQCHPAYLEPGTCQPCIVKR